MRLVAAILSAMMSMAAARGPQQVTCGSVLKLQNVHHKVRLHSHDVKYGSGSGQQSVTGTDQKEDVNSHWAVKGTGPRAHCKRGEPIACGQEVRFEHSTTGRNLHSHLFTSPLSNSQEISAFGEEGEGDTGDVWTVVCSGDFWNRDSPIQLKHVDTGVFLGASGHTFGRPIHGQMEIIGVTMPDVSTKWLSAEGIFVHPTEFGSKKKSHDEL